MLQFQYVGLFAKKIRFTVWTFANNLFTSLRFILLAAIVYPHIVANEKSLHPLLSSKILSFDIISRGKVYSKKDLSLSFYLDFFAEWAVFPFV